MWKLKFVDNLVGEIGYVHGWGIDIVGKTLDLTALIQGFYDSSTDKLIKDTVHVVLRKADPPFHILDVSKAILDSSGKGNFSFEFLPFVEFYIIVKHRNSIETWSVRNNPTFDTLSYNFTLGSSQAFGANQIQIDTSPLKFAMYNGDENQDGNVDVTDVVDIYNDALNFISGYVQTDINGDNFVDVSDLIITHNNSINFVSVIRP